MSDSSLKKLGPRFGISVPGTDLHLGIHEDRFRDSVILKEVDCSQHWLFTMMPCGEDLAAGGDDWFFLKFTANRKVLVYKKDKEIYLNASGSKLEAEDVDSKWPNKTTFLFRFDVENHLFQHHSGKYVQPEKGNVREGSKLRLVSLTGEQVKSAVRIMPCYYEDGAQVSGNWEKINAVVKPLATHMVKFVVKIGKSKDSTSRTRHTTDVTVEQAVSWFKASERHSMMTESVSKDSFSEEHTEERTITVARGDTVVTWQYVCEVTAGPDKHVFRTNIFQDTDSIGKVPDDPFGEVDGVSLEKELKDLDMRKADITKDELNLLSQDAPPEYSANETK